MASGHTGLAVTLVIAFLIGLITGPMIVDSLEAWRQTRQQVAQELGRMP